MAHKRIYGWTSCVCLLVGTAANGAVDYGVSAGVGHSDNIYRTAENKQDETIGSAGFALLWQQDSMHLKANVLADFAYMKFVHDSYDPEVVGRADALINLLIVPGNFEWMVADNFGQVRKNSIEPSTPDNRESVNFLETGPDFTAHFGSANLARLSGRYSRSDYESESLSSNRPGAELALIHEFSTASDLSLHVASEKIDYKEESLTDFDRRRAYLSYRFDGARTNATIDVGQTQVEFSTTKASGVLAKFDLSRRLTPFTTVSLRGGSDINDGVDAFRLEQDVPVSGTDALTTNTSAVPFTMQHLGLGWDFDRERTAFGVSANYYRESYEEFGAASQDRKRWLGEIHASRELNRFMKFDIGAEYLKARYDLGNEDYREVGAIAGLEWHGASKFGARLEYQYFTRSGQTEAYEYDENRLFLLFTYGVSTTAMQQAAMSRNQ